MRNIKWYTNWHAYSSIKITYLYHYINWCFFTYFYNDTSGIKLTSLCMPDRLHATDPGPLPQLYSITLHLWNFENILWYFSFLEITGYFWNFLCCLIFNYLHWSWCQSLICKFHHILFSNKNNMWHMFFL